MAIAGVKISTLRELNNAALDDFIVINDNSQNTTKKITIANLLKRTSTNIQDSDTGAFINGNIRASSAEVTGDVSVDGTINFTRLRDDGENLTIEKIISSSVGVLNGADDTTIPTTAAIKAYADGLVSDYRLKSNISEFSGALDMISDVLVYEYDLETTQKREVGVIAHELQEKIPYLVNGEKDAVSLTIHNEEKPSYQTVAYAKMVPILLAAIQELKEEVDTLKSQIEERG